MIHNSAVLRGKLVEALDGFINRLDEIESETAQEKFRDVLTRMRNLIRLNNSDQMLIVQLNKKITEIYSAAVSELHENLSIHVFDLEEFNRRLEVLNDFHREYLELNPLEYVLTVDNSPAREV